MSFTRKGRVSSPKVTFPLARSLQFQELRDSGKEQNQSPNIISVASVVDMAVIVKERLLWPKVFNKYSSVTALQHCLSFLCK